MPRFFLEKLMSLPHRGNATPEIEKAAEIILEEYKKHNVKGEIYEFKSAEQSHYLMSFITTLFIIALILKLFNNFILSLIFYFLGWVFYLNWLPIWQRFSLLFRSFSAKGIFAEVPSREKGKHTLVVSAHYDTPHATLGLNILRAINKTNFGRKLFSQNENLLFFLRGPLFLFNIAIIFLGIIIFLSLKWFLLLFFIPLILFLLALFLHLHMAFSSPVPGAFDNGSGTAVVMALAVYFAQNPLKNIRLIFLTNPCEEGYIDGFKEFFKKAKINKENTYFIVLDGVGAKNLKIVYKELSQAIGKTVRCDPILKPLIAELIASEEKFNQIKEFFLPVQSDATNILKRGGKTAFILTSINDDGFVDFYHQPEDTIDKINFNTLNLSYQFMIKLLQRVNDFLNSKSENEKNNS